MQDKLCLNPTLSIDNFKRHVVKLLFTNHQQKRGCHTNFWFTYA